MIEEYEIEQVIRFQETYTVVNEMPEEWRLKLFRALGLDAGMSVSHQDIVEQLTTRLMR